MKIMIIEKKGNFKFEIDGIQKIQPLKQGKLLNLTEVYSDGTKHTVQIKVDFGKYRYSFSSN